MKTFSGRKSLGGSAKTPTRYDDNLFGVDTVEVILGVSEGPCKGMVGGASGFLAADVPLVDPGTQTANISNFELRVLKGTNPADSIKPNLGGIGSSKNVGLELRAKNQQVVVSGTKNNIDYIDVRLNYGPIIQTDDKGNEVGTTLTLMIEIKRRSSSDWSYAFDNSIPPTTTPEANGATYRPNGGTPGSYVNANYHETYIRSTAPDTTTANPGAMWFDTSTPYRTPKILSLAHTWDVPANLTSIVLPGNFTQWTWTDLDGRTRNAFYDNTGNGASPDAGVISPNDFLITPNADQEVYAWNGVNWAASGDQFPQPVPQAPGLYPQTGITRNNYPREVRLPVNRIDEPYDIRITRISDTSTKYYIAHVTWESIQEITRDVYSFPGLALAHFTAKATDTFTSIPDFTQLWDGREIRVPSNYDPVARTFTGFWDGTWKIAFTNNTAFVAYDLVMNSTYGKNAYYPEVMDPNAVYEFGKHCDKHGFRMNEYITDPRSLNETINYVVGTAGGRYVDRGDGFSTILFDADDQPAVAQFTPENVIDGLFTYDFTDITARKNAITVSYISPLIGWKEDRITVFDQAEIDAQGYNPEEFIAVGCTDAEEAVKRARLRLATALTEKTIVSFKTNRQGLYVQPYQVILIADPLSDTAIISGRILSVLGPTTLILRDAIYLEEGVNLSVTFTVPDGNGGFTAQSVDLVSGNRGLTSTLQLASQPGFTIPEKAVFSIGTPKAFRITSIEEGDTIDNVSITAIEVNRLKWAYVDGEVELDDILTSQTGTLSRYVFPATGLNVSGNVNADGTISVTLSWTASQSKVGGYRIYQSLNGGQSNSLGEVGVTQVLIPNIVDGIYIFTVVALSADRSTESAPAAIRFSLAGPTEIEPFRPVVPIANLHLINEPRSPLFDNRDPSWGWDNSTDPLLDHYYVEILDTTTTTVIYSQSQNKAFNYFTFPFSLNQQINGQALRNLTIRVRAVDTRGNTSDPLTMQVSHPAPVAPVPSFTPTDKLIVASYPTPAEADAQGSLLWISTQQGFSPDLQHPDQDSKSSPIILSVSNNTTYYIRMAIYDSYSKVGLNLSAEYSVTTSDSAFDKTDPGIPQNFALTSNTVDIAPDGGVFGKAVFSWTALGSSNLAKYEVAVAPGNNPPDGAYIGGNFLTGNTFTEQGLVPGQVYSAKVRSISQNGFGISGWSTVVTFTAALNQTPPAPVTGLIASAAFQNAFLSWINPVDKDLAYVEIFAGPTNVLSNATKIATVAAPGNSFSDNTLAATATKFYWARSVNTSGVAATSYAGPAQATSAAITGAQISAQTITAANFASNIAPVEIFSGLPTTGNFDGRQVFLTTDKKLYRYSTTANSFIKSVDGGDIVANSITSGQIATGAIKAAQLDANSVIASKLAVVSQNRAYNADGSQGLYGYFSEVGQASGVTVSLGQDSSFSAPGSRRTYTVISSGTLNATNQITVGSHTVDSTGGVSNYPVVAGTYYELSAFISSNFANNYVQVLWYYGDGSLASSSNGNIVGDQQTSWLVAKAPAGTTSCYIRVLGSDSFARTSGSIGISNLMWCEAKSQTQSPPQTEPSPYVDWQITAISGGNIITGTLNANRIIAGTITTDLMRAGSIIVDTIAANGSISADKLNANVLVANNIKVGNGTLTTLFAGTNTTTIDGGAISANSIAANKIRIGSRGINTIGIEFAMVRDANGNVTNTVSWTTGYVLWVNDQGLATSNQIPAGSASMSTGLYVFWDTNNPNVFSASNDWGVGGIQTATKVLMASVTSGTGLAVFYGGTVIDGDKITARSITALNIAVGSLTGDRIAGNTITGSNIVGNTITGDKIAANSITAKHIVISDNSNMITNGDFGSFTGVPNSDGWSLQGDAVIETASANDDGGACRLTGTSRVLAYGNFYGCQPGDNIYLSCMVYNGGGGKTVCNLYVEFYDANTQNGAGGYAATTTALQSWTRLEGQVTVPVGKMKFRIVVFADPDGNSGRTYWGRFQVRRAAGASLIVDGSITAVKIQANSISADRLAVGFSASNLLFNSDNVLDGYYNTFSTDGTATRSARTTLQTAPGMQAGFFNAPGLTPASGASLVLQYLWPAVGGGTTFKIPASGNQRYEVSAYLSVYRCAGAYVNLQFFDINGNEIGNYSGTTISPTGYYGPLSPSWRSYVIGVSPANTAYIGFRIIGVANGNNDPYIFCTAPYVAVAAAGSNQLSPYQNNGGTTIIAGGSISTTSLSTISANIGDATQGRIRSADGKFVIDLNNRYLAIYD